MPANLKSSKLFILMAIILFIVMISFFVNFLYGWEIVYTHLFYLPIILAGIWYHRKALYVAAFLGFFHVAINFFQSGLFSYSTLTRGFIFCIIAYVFGTLAEKKDNNVTALHEAQQEKSLILKNLSELVILHDNEQHILWANPAAGRSFGVNHEAIVGLKCYEALQYRNTPCDECPVKKALETGEVHSGEITTPDGRWWSIIGSPVRNDNGDIVGVIETALNITERKRAELELQKLNIELEQRVQERTAELESLNKELDAFSYSVSHDLRSPLYSIQGFSQALLEDYSEILDEQGKDYLNRVYAAGQRMGELIDDLLKLSRVARLEMHREEVDLSAFAASYLSALQEQEPGRQVHTIIAPGMVVTGDASLLRIAVENLLGNAWKFTKHVEHAEIEFNALQYNYETVYSIRDNGAGFDMSYAKKLFAPFQRLHTQEEFSGTGIGLSIVSRIVQRHSGKVWAKSEVGQGATFYFTLDF